MDRMEGSSFLNPASVVRAAGVHEGLVVADFGAGSGFFTRAAARAVGPHAKVWAVDAHRDMLSRIKNLSLAEGLSNVEVVYGNVERQGGSNLPPQSMDFVLCTNLLFGVEDKEKVLQEARRVLRRGGRALIIDWQGSFGGLGPHPDHVVAAAAAKKLCEDAGLLYASDLKAGAYHWGFVVRKKT